MSRLAEGALWLCLLVAGASAFAHQQKEAITRVLFNERTGNIEVMHRFLIHDAEHAMRRHFGDAFDLLGSATDRARFEAYVHERFVLTDDEGEALALRAVGNEIDHEFLWVYAETAIPEGLASLTVSHDALRDVWSSQSNLVNVERAGEVRSATFDGSRTEVTIAF